MTEQREHVQTCPMCRRKDSFFQTKLSDVTWSPDATPMLAKMGWVVGGGELCCSRHCAVRADYASSTRVASPIARTDRVIAPSHDMLAASRDREVAAHAAESAKRRGGR